MARVERVALFEHEVRARLGAAAVEVLFGAARVQSEGRLDPGNPALAGRDAGRSAYFGSTMLTIDLGALTAAPLRDAGDPEAAAAEVAALAAADPRVLRRAQRLAEREAARIAGRRFAEVKAEVRVSARGPVVHVDVDVEATLVPALRVVAGGGR